MNNLTQNYAANNQKNISQPFTVTVIERTKSKIKASHKTFSSYKTFHKKYLSKHSYDAFQETKSAPVSFFQCNSNLPDMPSVKNSKWSLLSLDLYEPRNSCKVVDDICSQLTSLNIEFSAYTLHLPKPPKGFLQSPFPEWQLIVPINPVSCPQLWLTPTIQATANKLIELLGSPKGLVHQELVVPFPRCNPSQFSSAKTRYNEGSLFTLSKGGVV